MRKTLTPLSSTRYGGSHDGRAVDADGIVRVGMDARGGGRGAIVAALALGDALADVTIAIALGASEAAAKVVTDGGATLVVA